MKNYATFALVVCLTVLAIALVLGITRPEILDAIVDFLRKLFDSILHFISNVADGLRIVFGQR